jgi:riboflavin kinase / FMN adenylyltransferase
METARIGSLAPLGWPPSAVTIGNFDGVHRGHEALVSVTVTRARAAGGPSVVLTFDPHPARVLRPAHAPAALTTMAQKEELLGALGLDRLAVLRFDADLARLSPEEFARAVLRDTLHARDVVVGESFRFGHRREGDARTLVELGARLGFDVHAIPAVLDGGRPVSSSRVRSELGHGHVAAAAALLGRAYFVDAAVVRGEGRGRTIGIPTANLDCENEILPAPGVYAGFARVPGGDAWPAVVNLGRRPTFGGGDLFLEAHLLGFDGDLYGARVRLSFHERLRDEERFPSKEALVARIREDIARARELLSASGEGGV